MNNKILNRMVSNSPNKTCSQFLPVHNFGTMPCEAISLCSDMLINPKYFVV
jgi:hypothetical protein